MAAIMDFKSILTESLRTVKTYVDGLLDNKSNNDHTHNYAGSSSVGGTANSVNGFDFWVGTQEEYDAMTQKNATTVYMIKEDIEKS